MNRESAGITRAIPEPFEKAMPLVRRLLSDQGLTVVQFDRSRELLSWLAGRSCMVLLVDTPVLLFEAIALDRAAAVFLPLHIVVSGDRDMSYVHWVNPISGSGLRPPAPARAALEELYARVTGALSELPQAAEIACPKQPI